VNELCGATRDLCVLCWVCAVLWHDGVGGVESSSRDVFHSLNRIQQLLCSLEQLLELRTTFGREARLESVHAQGS
jgi:hypothetical protein